MSVSNQGLWFEKEIGLIATAYREKRLLDISKVDPPTKVIRNPAPMVIMLASPFLDYVGSWTERNGRAVFLEAKSTKEAQLPLDQESGVKVKQRQCLERWHGSGAAVGVLWGHADEIRFVSLTTIHAQLAAGTKHLKWDNARPLKRGFGFCTWDFLQALRLYYPAPE